MTNRIFSKIVVFGRDKPGIVAAVTGLIFSNGGNIEEITQNVAHGTFSMELAASWKPGVDRKAVAQWLDALGTEIGMEIRCRFETAGAKPRMAVIAGGETHSLKALLEKKDSLGAQFALVMGADPKARALAEKHGVPYYSLEHAGSGERETQIEKLLSLNEIDFVVLANYLRVLSPSIVWRYPNRIINIHGSLLPAFTGPHPYRQALLKGARIAGCTAHFVVAELDAGPIICQEAFPIGAGESFESVYEKGKEAEAKAITKAVKLFAAGKLEVRGGVVREKQ
jgi:formyltetrahydrofolate deformylase